MEIKGTAVKSIQEFVKKKYPDKYNNWLESLPLKSKEIMSGHIYATQWYPLKQGAIEPTKAIGKMFYNGDNAKAAWESGKHSAEQGLKGVYKIFVMVANPGFIIKRASRVFKSYYNPCDIVVANSHSKGVEVHITKFPEPDPIVENRIAGWIEMAFVITGCKNVRSKITQSMSKKAEYTAIETTWD